MATEVIAFPDAEALVISYLKPKMGGVTVTTKVPNPRPANGKLIKVTRLGGSQLRLNADSPLLAFECWGSTTVEASELCRLARAYVTAMAGEKVNGTWVYKVREVGGPAFFPDPDSDSPRYQFSVAIDMKGVAL
ncbi:hypothetical protein [Streptomyces lasalocidi]|uniref:DUF3168 domain-containing protein n=1 Tax=Streptomyces lasalocidi TaxID=324833 RepID=A0A4V6AWD0_STRLS|nr:hypothetical protein [Streptomyces lasalocidi]TKT03443.1 hypothetical protein E4U91_27350 [Streptomyces lasalocidi]